MSGDRGTAPHRDEAYLRVSSGGIIHPFAPRQDEIWAVDLARGLSRSCRYGGQVLVDHYSVAQHSVLVSRFAQHMCGDAGRKRSCARWGLLHDAAEAYVADIQSPMKQHLPDYRALENVLLAAVLERAGLPAEQPPEVSLADRVLFDRERESGIAPTSEVHSEPPPEARIVALSAAASEQLWLAQFCLLFGADCDWLEPS